MFLTYIYSTVDMHISGINHPEVLYERICSECFGKLQEDISGRVLNCGNFNTIVTHYGHVPGFFPIFLEQLFCRYLRVATFVFSKVYESVYDATRLIRKKTIISQAIFLW